MVVTPVEVGDVGRQVEPGRRLVGQLDLAAVDRGLAGVEDRSDRVMRSHASVPAVDKSVDPARQRGVGVGGGVGVGAARSGKTQTGDAQETFHVDPQVDRGVGNVHTPVTS